eukprot:353336-Chlamydomonas_euryale.AAC.16
MMRREWPGAHLLAYLVGTDVKLDDLEDEQLTGVPIAHLRQPCAQHALSWGFETTTDIKRKACTHVIQPHACTPHAHTSYNRMHAHRMHARHAIMLSCGYIERVVLLATMFMSILVV